MIITLREYVQLTCAVGLGVAREVCAASLGVQVRCWERWEEGTRTMATAYWELAVLKLSQGQQATNYQLLYEQIERYVAQQSLYEEMHALIDMRSTRKQGILPASFTDSLKLHIERHRTGLAAEVCSIEPMEQHSADIDSRISAVPQNQSTDNKVVEQPGRGEYANAMSACEILKSAQDSRMSVGEVVRTVRQFVDNTLGGCDRYNRALTSQAISNRLGVGKTTASTYLAFARLEDDDPVLKQLLDGDCSSIREAYKIASERLRDLRASAERKAFAQMGIKVDGAS